MILSAMDAACGEHYEFKKKTCAIGDNLFQWSVHTYRPHPPPQLHPGPIKAIALVNALS